MPDVRPGRGAAHEPHGDPAGRLSGRENRRHYPPAAADGDGADAFEDGKGEAGKGNGFSPAWSPEAQERLARVPGFVRGMVKRIYLDYAKDRGIAEITPAVMDTARGELGLEGM